MTSSRELNRFENLRKVCLHEHGHAAVARHFGEVGGWVTITEYRKDELNPLGAFFNGRYYGERIKSRVIRRLVGLAGIVAELLDDEPNITADEIEQRLTSAPPLYISDSDFAMIGDVTSRTRVIALWQCIEIVRRRWPEITKAAVAEAEAVLANAPGAL